MINPDDVTMIIPHLGQTKEQEYSLDQCLESLFDTASGIKVIVAKNGKKCTEHTIEPGVRNNTMGIDIEDQGQCKAVNAAAATVNTPWIMVSNDDMIYSPGWFQQLTFWVNDEMPWCISPKLVEPRPGAPTFDVHFCGGAGGDFDKQKFYSYVESLNIVPTQETGIRTGFNLPFLIRKDVWDLVGGYDIAYDPWSSNSDSDLLYKIRLAGIVPRQAQNSLVYHFSQTSGTFEPQNQAAWNKNWSYFIEKWGFPRTDDGIWEATFHLPTIGEGRKFAPHWEDHYLKIKE
jgi:GT2 family glycosyltransferase